METTVFNFKENWNLVEKHLKDEEVLSALDDGMNDYLLQHPDETEYFGDWNRKKKVWSLTKSECWGEEICKRVEEKFPDWEKKWFKDKNVGIQDIDWMFFPDKHKLELEKAGLSVEFMDKLEDLYNEEGVRLAALVEPQSNTYEFYQAFGLHTWISPFCLELGKKIYPSLNWRVVGGDRYSMAVGFDEAENPVVVFDILHFNSPKFLMAILSSNNDSENYKSGDGNNLTILNLPKMSNDDYLSYTLDKVIEEVRIILDDEKAKGAEFPDDLKKCYLIQDTINSVAPATEMWLYKENILKYHLREVYGIHEMYYNEEEEARIADDAFSFLVVKCRSFFKGYGIKLWDDFRKKRMTVRMENYKSGDENNFAILNSHKNSKDDDYLSCAFNRITEGIQTFLDDEKIKGRLLPDDTKKDEIIMTTIDTIVSVEELELNKENIFKYHSKKLNKIWEEIRYIGKNEEELNIEEAAFAYLLTESCNLFSGLGQKFFDDYRKLEATAEVFDFEKNWHLVEKHLNDEKVLSALDVGMNAYLCRYPEVKEDCGDWSRGKGAWIYRTSNSFWSEGRLKRVEKKFPDWDKKLLKEKGFARQNRAWILYLEEYLDEIEEAGWTIEFMKELKELYFKELHRLEALIKPSTYEFYQAFGLSYWLAPFCRELGKKICPSLNWKTQETLAIGFDKNENPKMIFDINRFDYGPEVLVDFAAHAIRYSDNCDYLPCALYKVIKCIQIILGDERSESAEFPDMEKIRETVPMFIGTVVPAEEMKFNEENMLEHHSEELNKIWEKYEKGEMKIEGAAFLYLLIKSLDWLEEHGEEFFDNIE